MHKSTPSPKTGNLRMCMLPVSKLMIDHTYQRNSLSQRNVDQIVKNYSVGSFGALNVAERNGIFYYVVDGQHRLAAAKKLGLTVVPCAVWVSTGVEQEAAEFERCNSARKSVDYYTKYRAMVVAKDPAYLLCEKILAKHGLHIAQSCSANCIAFPSTAMTTLKSDPNLFELCLVLQRLMVGDINLGEQIHKGLFYALNRINPEQWPSVDLCRKVYELGGRTAIMHEIRRLHLESGSRAESGWMYGKAVVNVLNKSIGRGKKIEMGGAA